MCPPRSTMSVGAGGNEGAPAAAVQFAGSSHAEPDAPVQRATFRSSDNVHRPSSDARPVCSTQFPAESDPLFGVSLQLDPLKCQGRSNDSLLPLSSGSS